MDEDYKRRIEGAIERFSERKRKERLGPSRKNQKPEEEVVKRITEWMDNMGWFWQRYESKAKMIGGVWRSSGLRYGTPDLQGSTETGLMFAVEVKAPGKRSSLREAQREYLMSVIAKGGFGVCVDSVQLLDATWQHFNAFTDKERRAERLYSMLP